MIAPRLQSFALCFLGIFVITGCHEAPRQPFSDLMQDAPAIPGKTSSISSPYVTAGDRVYVVGYQDGSFPELGWHIKNEMGGVWDHPIKWLDGFEAKLSEGQTVIPLNKADSFINYPMANEVVYRLRENALNIRRFQFVPDHLQGLVIQYVISNSSDDDRDLTFDFTASSDLRPTWLGDRTGMEDAADTVEYLKGKDGLMFRDTANPWVVVAGANRQSAAHASGSSVYEGLGISGTLGYSIAIPPNGQETIGIYIAGSAKSREEALADFQTIKSSSLELFTRKRDRYAGLAQRSELTTPDSSINEAFEWLKYNSDWLIRSVPDIGTGISAGIPDYPWWFGVDSEYALKGYLAVGQTDIVYSTVALLDSLSRVSNRNGRIIHEVSTNGAVYNKGNINETPQFVSLIREVYRWTGDKAFLQAYFPTIEKGLAWLMDENDTDHNGFPEGFGMMEIHGLNSEMIDVACYTQQAFADASWLAEELGKKKLASGYATRAASLRKKINEEFWSEDFDSFADFIGTDREALDLIGAALTRADSLKKPWAVTELLETRKYILQHPSSQSRPFVLHHNWVVNTPMETGIADRDKGFRALNTAQKFVNPYGVFVTGIDRDASAGSDTGSFQGSKVFSYVGAVMTLPTGVQAVAENNYGRPERALDYLTRMTRSFSYALPGSMYEVSPDYGMMTQAWNIYGFAYPIVRQFFGISPEAAHHEIIISPQMPAAWNKASIEHVKIGDNEIAVFYEIKDGRHHIRATQTLQDWSLIIKVPQQTGTIYEPITGQPKRQGNQLLFAAENGVVEVAYKRQD